MPIDNHTNLRHRLVIDYQYQSINWYWLVSIDIDCHRLSNPSIGYPRCTVCVLNTINSNKRIGIFSAEIFTIQVAYFIEIFLIQSQVVSSNHFGSRMKHSYLLIYGKLVCRELITTDVDYMLAEIVGSSFTARGRSEWIMQRNIFAVLWS